MTRTTRRRLVAVDCDGTFFDRDGYPSARTLQVAQRLSDAGHHLIAATGRSRLTASDRLRAVPGLRHIVCSNGAYAWDMQSDGLQWETTLAPPVVAGIVDTLRAAMPDVSFGWETRGGIGFEKAFIDLAGGIDQLEHGGDAGDPWEQPLYKLKARRPQQQHQSLHDAVHAVLADSPCEITTSGAPFVEITAHGSHKGSGVSRIAGSIGISAADTIVFGDHNNDLAMFRWAGHAVAMGNAVAAVHAEADASTRPNHEHGVAHYLDGLFDAGEL